MCKRLNGTKRAQKEQEIIIFSMERETKITNLEQKFLYTTSKILVVKSTMFLQRNILKYTWTSLDRKTHNQIDHILIDRRCSSILDVRGFRRADCDTDHYLVVAKVWERLAVSKQAAQKFEGERFNLRKLNELQIKKQCQIEITKKGLQLWRT